MNDPVAFKVAAPGKGLPATLLALFIVPVAGVALAAAWSGSAGLAVDDVARTALVAALVIGLIGLAARRRGIAFDGRELVVRATLYTFRIPVDALDPGAARIIDLREQRDARPRLKTNGFAIPGLQAGYFRDARKRRLMCLVTAPRVLLLPLADGRRLLVSAARPAEMLEQLGRACGDGEGGGRRAT